MQQILRRSAIRLPVGRRASLHATASARLAYKDSQDRQTLRPRSSEHTLSGRDDDAAAAPAAGAAYDGSETRPEAEKRRSDDGSLAASPANHGLSKPRGEKGDAVDGGPATETEKGGASGGGSAPKKGKP
ncbi:hypothetical protein XA68_12192 [Ophiocordyceps unilateralis]|uniref:Uncharacterized protein n=1 Tax=Ophiocordyceps unilateralis TaxID=268505 RepID=A0A2A9PFA3_OPHUN|nr:hypothetical protein XA68_12192 [Ophiocordyceps unilateralis]